MPRPKHMPEIIIGKLREIEVLVAKGATVAEASRQIGVTEQTLYRGPSAPRLVDTHAAVFLAPPHPGPALFELSSSQWGTR